MNSFTGLHAEMYDIIYSEKSYRDEARFVHELSGRRGGRLLDVACGTGRHAEAFATLGYEVTGVDLNPAFVELARERDIAGARFEVGDMRTLDVRSSFDVVTCLFDSLGYALDNAGVVSALHSLRRHTLPDGIVVCEVLHAPAMLTKASGTRVVRIAIDDQRSLLRTSRTRLDVETMLMHVDYDVIALGPGDRAHAMHERQTNRFFSVPELRLLAETAGLVVQSVLAAYDEGPIQSDTFHVLLVASPAV